MVRGGHFVAGKINYTLFGEAILSEFGTYPISFNQFRSSPPVFSRSASADTNLPMTHSMPELDKRRKNSINDTVQSINFLNALL